MNNKTPVFAILLAVIFVLSAVTGCNTSEEVTYSPEETVNAYYNALKEKDIRTAFSLNKDLKDIDEEQLELVEPLFAAFEIKSFDIGNTEKINDSEYNVDVNVTTLYQGDERSFINYIGVVKIDGNWYIDESKGSDDAETKFGQPLDREQYDEVQIEDLLEDPHKYAGEKIIVRAEKGGSCGGGCHFNISDGKNSIFVASEFQTFTPHGTPVMILGQLRVRPGQEPFMVALGLEVIQ